MKNIFNKKSQSEIITTVLIILLVLASIVIVWNVVFNLIEKSASDIEEQSDPVFIKIDQFKIYSNQTMDIIVYYGTGDITIKTLQFIFEDENGQTKIINRNNLNLKLKETRTYRFTKAEVGLGNIIKVSVIPLYGSNRGIPATRNIRKCLGSSDC